MTDKRGIKKDRVIEGVSTNECPVSFITAQSMSLLELVTANRLSKNAGAPLFGTDAGRWPAWWHDAIATVESASDAYESARAELTK